jgi:predicted transcriptional regulator
MQRLLHLCATERGSKFEYKVDNEEIVGKNHRAVIPKADAKRILSGHRYGKQIKHYHPKHVRKSDANDPLYHPKVGVLLKKSLTGSAFDWHRRRKLRREIDETLINLLYWSDVPVHPALTTYVPDDHFEVREADRQVGLESDPTPEMETNQETLLVTTLRDMCDSDVSVLESLVRDGEDQHPRELAQNTEHGLSTIYRALQRLDGIVRNDGANVSFASRKFHQEITGIVESVEHHIENAADRAAQILNIETRDAASSAWQKWCDKYAARIVDAPDDGRMTVRIDTMLSKLKATSYPRLADVLDEALTAWRKHGRDVLELRNAIIKWRDSSGSWRTGKVATALR